MRPTSSNQRKEGSTTARSTGPCVGIFWMLPDGRLIAESSSLSAAEKYGNCLTHSGSHIDAWAELQMNGQVAADVEYEEYPRGRVSFEIREDRFLIMADRCILCRKDLVRKIKMLMNLTGKQTEVSPDLHYRCSRCLYGPPEENRDEA
jgi:hypothetical protein